MSKMQGPIFPSLAIATLTLVLATPSFGQLSIVRQGKESRGILELGDSFGTAVASGDFDGDGKDDLASGAPNESLFVDPLPEHGAVVVSYGSTHGLTWIGADLLLPTDGGYTDSGHFGAAVASGDFDADGYDDLAVGMPDATWSLQPAAGLLFVYYGGPGGLGGAPTVFDQGDFGGAVEAGDQFGFALAAGRIGTASYDDLIAGAPGEDASRGVIFLLHGGLGGLTAGSGAFIKPADIGAPAASGGRFGAALAIGDVRGGVWADAIVGAPDTDIGFITAAGMIHILAGTSAGNLVTGSALHYDSETAAGQFYESFSRFGHSLASGDFYGDGGPNDFVVGQPGGDGAAGRVMVGKGDVGVPSFPIVLDQADGGNAAESGDRFGWAVAAGDWNADGSDDVAVGTPGEDIESAGGLGTDSGNVHVFPGGPNGPNGSGFERFSEAKLGEQYSGAAALGKALTFGRFGQSARQSVAAGAPDKTVGTGQVFDIAPWRQVMDLTCKTSIAADCNDDIVFAQKPFEQVFVASTTKIMTILLGCEAASLPVNNPNYISLNSGYIIEPWMAVGFPQTSGCSTFGFIVGEWMNFENLMRTCTMVSGNDSAMAIADKMTGEVNQWNGYTNTAPLFVQEMNDRAAQLGMVDTNFTNPPGVDSGSPMSTAYDMYLLTRHAMSNSTFRDIVGTVDYGFLRLIPWVNGWLLIGDAMSYSYLQSIKGVVPSANGVKDGSTPGAQRTGVYTATQFGDRVTVTGFGWPSWGERTAQGGELLTLAMKICEPGFTMEQAPQEPFAVVPAVSMELDRRQCLHFDPLGAYSSPAYDGLVPELKVELQAQDLPWGVAWADLVVSHESYLELAVGASTTFSADDVEAHDGVVIRNIGSDPAMLQITSGVGGAQNVILVSGEAYTLPAEVYDPDFDRRLVVSNIGSSGADVGVTELGYRYRASLGDGTTPNRFGRVVWRDTGAYRCYTTVCVEGLDPEFGNTAVLVVRDSAVPYDHDAPTPRSLEPQQPLGTRGLSRSQNPPSSLKRRL